MVHLYVVVPRVKINRNRGIKFYGFQSSQDTCTPDYKLTEFISKYGTAMNEISVRLQIHTTKELSSNGYNSGKNGRIDVVKISL